MVAPPLEVGAAHDTESAVTAGVMSSAFGLPGFLSLTVPPLTVAVVAPAVPTEPRSPMVTTVTTVTPITSRFRMFLMPRLQRVPVKRPPLISPYLPTIRPAGRQLVTAASTQKSVQSPQCAVGGSRSCLLYSLAMAKALSPEAIASNTGQSWDDWLLYLDGAGAAQKNHQEIVALAAANGAPRGGDR